MGARGPRRSCSRLSVTTPTNGDISRLMRGRSVENRSSAGSRRREPCGRERDVAELGLTVADGDEVPLDRGQLLRRHDRPEVSIMSPPPVPADIGTPPGRRPGPTPMTITITSAPRERCPRRVARRASDAAGDQQPGDHEEPGEQRERWQRVDTAVVPDVSLHPVEHVAHVGIDAPPLSLERGRYCPRASRTRAGVRPRRAAATGSTSARTSVAAPISVEKAAELVDLGPGS